MVRKTLNSKPKESAEGKNATLFCVSTIVNKLMEDSRFHKKIDKTKLIEFLSTLAENLPREQLISITDEELARRIEKVMLIETMAGMLHELTPAQMESFETALQRRMFFNGEFDSCFK
jgi:hypothetical protein